MNVAQWKAVALLSGVFLFGGITGVAGSLAFLHRRGVAVHPFEMGPRSSRPLMALYRKLELTSEQRERIASIIEKRAPTRRRLMSEVMQSCGQSIRDEKAKLDAEIREVLTPEQRTRFDELSARQFDRLFSPFGESAGERAGESMGEGPRGPRGERAKRRQGGGMSAP